MPFPPRLSTLQSQKDKFPKASKAAESHSFVLQNHRSFTQTASAFSGSCPPSPSPPLPSQITNQRFPGLRVRMPSTATAPKTRGGDTAWCPNGRRVPQSPKGRGGFKARRVWGLWLQGEGKDMGRLDPAPALRDDSVGWRGARRRRGRRRGHLEQHPKRQQCP